MSQKKSLNLEKLILKTLSQKTTPKKREKKVIFEVLDACSQYVGHGGTKSGPPGYSPLFDKSSYCDQKKSDGTQKYCCTPNYCFFKLKNNTGENCLTEDGTICGLCNKDTPSVKDKKAEEESKRRQRVIDAKKAAEEAERKRNEDAQREMDKWNARGYISGYSQGYIGDVIQDMQECIDEIPDGGKITDRPMFWGQSTEDKLHVVLPLLPDTNLANELLDKLQKLKTNPSDRINAFSYIDIMNICLQVHEYHKNANLTDQEEDINAQKVEKNDSDVEQKVNVDYIVEPVDESKKNKRRRVIKEDLEGEDPYSQLVILKQLLKYKYCLPKWFETDEKIYTIKDPNSGRIQNYVIIGTKKWPSSNDKPGYFWPDPKPETEGKKYYVYSDLTIENIESKEKQKIKCSQLEEFRKSVLRRDNYIKILKKFGIKDAETIEESELLTKVNDVTTKINEMVNDNSYKSDDFRNWDTFLREYYKDNQNDIIQLTKQKSLTYTELPDVQKQNYVDTSKDINDKLGWKITVYKLLNQFEWMDYIAKQGCTPELARKVLTKYLREAIIETSGAGTIPPSNDFIQMKDQIYRCKRSGQYKDDDKYTSEEVFGTQPGNYSNIEASPFKKYGDPLKFSQIADYLSGKEATNILGFERKYKGKYLIRPNDWIIDKLNESFELKDKIKLSLNETVLEKRKIIQQEKLVRSRVTMLIESSKFKSKNQRRDFIVNLLQESLYLDSQGFNKQIINEEFWDVIKGFFGDEGSQSVFKSFKNKMSEWLVSHLSPKKADGWIGDCIRKTIKEIDMEDVHLITNCKFLSRKISRSVVEKLKQKMTNDELRDEGIYDVVRGGMADNVKSAKFRAHIEQKVERMICPILYDMSNRFDSTFEKMKKRTLNMFD